jgi:hypothetical protein
MSSITDPRNLWAGWGQSRWLAVCELAFVVALVVADIHRLVSFSKTPFYLVLGWASLRLRGLGWRSVGFTLPTGWRQALALGTLVGIVLELFSAFVIEPSLARLVGRSADLSDFRPLVGNAGLQAALDGLLLGLLYLGARRNLLVPIVSHGVSNSLAFVLIYFGRYPGV